MNAVNTSIGADLVERFVRHAKSRSWIARGCFIHDRGWRRVGDFSEWQSPHDSVIYRDSIIPMAIEMALEAEGTPTPRSGYYVETERGEAKK